MKRKRKQPSAAKKKGVSLSRAQMKKLSGGTRSYNVDLPLGSWEADMVRGDVRDSRYRQRLG